MLVWTSFPSCYTRGVSDRLYVILLNVTRFGVHCSQLSIVLWWILIKFSMWFSVVLKYRRDFLVPGSPYY